MLNEETKRIRKKQKLVMDLCKEKEKKLELCEQVAICEELAKPLTETMIKELVTLPLRQMQNKIRNYKLA